MTDLNQLSNRQLLDLLADLLRPGPAMSALFFRISISPEFKDTSPGQLFDLITAILRSRIPEKTTTNPAAASP